VTRMKENDEWAADRARIRELELSKAGLERFITYVESGAIMVKRRFLELAWDYRGRRNFHVDEALAGFEKSCRFAELPTPEEIEKKDSAVFYYTFKEPRDSDCLSKKFYIDILLLKVYVAPVLHAFDVEEEYIYV
jgi:hypothetical protein